MSDIRSTRVNEIVSKQKLKQRIMSVLGIVVFFGASIFLMTKCAQEAAKAETIPFYNPDYTEGTVFIAMLFLGLIVYFIFFNDVKMKTTKRTLKTLSQSDLDAACAEIEKQNTLKLEDKKLYVGENYIVQLNAGLDVVKYSDIAWVYETRTSMNGVPTATSLTVWTKDKVKHSLASYQLRLVKVDGKREFRIPDERDNHLYSAIFDYIVQRAPGAIHHFNGETQRLAKQQYGIRN